MGEMLRRQDAACAHLPMYRPHFGPGSVAPYVQSYSPCCSFAEHRARVDVDELAVTDAVNRHSGSADVDIDVVNGHNAQVSKLLQFLGATGAGGRAVIDAVAKLQGIDDADWA